MKNTFDTYTVVDIETTGLDIKKEKITEIGAYKIENGKLVDRFEMLVNPGRLLEKRIVELTGITDEELLKAPYIGEVIEKFVAFETTGVLVGHSILFDYSFLKKAAVNNGFSFEKQGIDTLAISRKYLQDLESRSLPFLCKHFEISHQPHRALSDVEATWELLKRLERDFLNEESKDYFSPKPLHFNVKKESPIQKKQIEQLNRYIDYYKLEDTYDLNSLTKNEASRYIDCLISQYGRIPPRER